MKTWKRTFGTALTLALFTGCTVTVGNGKGDDTDDIDFTDKSEEPETTEEEEETTTTSETSTPAVETTEPTTTTSEETPTSSEPATSSTAGETSSGPDETSKPPPFNACEPAPEADSCNGCVETYCEADWEACCGDPDCMAEWTALYECMVENPTEDPWYDFDTCAASVSTTGDALDLHPKVQYITSCVNAEYTGEPDDLHAAGDGTCTLLCYNWETLGEP